MIVKLNGQDLARARHLAHRFIQKTQPKGSRSNYPLESASGRRFRQSAKSKRIEAERMAHKVKGTTKMAAAIRAALEVMRKDYFSAAGLREASHGDLSKATKAIKGKALANAMAVSIEEAYKDGRSSAIAELTGTIDFDLQPERAMDDLMSRSLAFADEVAMRERDGIKAILMSGLAEGMSSADLSDSIVGYFAAGMHILNEDGDVSRTIPEDSWADMVARTEITNSQTAGVMDVYMDAGIEKIVWLTAEDERTSFFAGTPVVTSRGEIEIENICSGDYVSTPSGMCRVTEALAYEHKGGWTIVSAGGKSLLTTADHPFWTGHGWCNADELTIGDRLQSVDNEAVEVDCLVHFKLTESDYSPSDIGEELFLARISVGVFLGPVPKDPIGFDSDFNRVNGKVCQPDAPKPGFLFKEYPQPLKRLADSALQGRFALRSAPAITRTKPSYLSALGIKSFPTPLAVGVTCVGGATGAGTESPEAIFRRWDGEDLPALRTGFIQSVADEWPPAWLTAQAQSSAGVRAKPCDSVQMTAEELTSALFALGLERHKEAILSIAGGSRAVFNLEVEGAQVFYADGLLVHNCPTCDLLDGSTTPLGEPFDFSDEGVEQPPEHPNAVLEGSLFVPYGQVQEMVRARYRGPAVGVVAGDYNLTIGPNHPMLTRRGMVPAHLLKEGDELVYDCRVNPPGSLNSNLEKVELVEDVFSAYAADGANSLVSTPGHDFHGDRKFCQGEVQGIRPKRELLSVLNSGGIEEGRESGFMRADSDLTFVTGQRPSGAPDRGVDCPTPRSVSGGRSYGSHFKFVGITEVAIREFTGLAFDATTASGLYSSGGFVVANCRCTIVADTSEADTSGVDAADAGIELDAGDGG